MNWLLTQIYNTSSIKQVENDIESRLVSVQVQNQYQPPQTEKHRTHSRSEAVQHFPARCAPATSSFRAGPQSIAADSSKFAAVAVCTGKVDCFLFTLAKSISEPRLILHYNTSEKI
jgi:hypothetical protein